MTSPPYTTSVCPVLLLNSRAGPVIQAFPSADARDTHKPPGAAVRSRPPPPHLTGSPAAPARRTPGPPRPGRAGSPRPGTAASPAAPGRRPRPPSTRRRRRRRRRHSAQKVVRRLAPTRPPADRKGGRKKGHHFRRGGGGVGRGGLGGAKSPALRTPPSLRQPGKHRRPVEGCGAAEESRAEGRAGRV